MEVALAADAGFEVFDDVAEEVGGDGGEGVGAVEELAFDGLGLGVAEGLAGLGVEAELVVVDQDEGAAVALEVDPPLLHGGVVGQDVVADGAGLVLEEGVDIGVVDVLGPGGGEGAGGDASGGAEPAGEGVRPRNLLRSSDPR